MPKPSPLINRPEKKPVVAGSKQGPVTASYDLKLSPVALKRRRKRRQALSAAEMRKAMSSDPHLTVLSSAAFQELLDLGEQSPKFSSEAKEAVAQLRALQRQRR
jgi:hypothetical protein